MAVGSTVLWLAVAAVHGALGASRNDDWTYYRIVFEMAQTGHFAPDPYTKTMLVGQVLAALPVVSVLGPSITGLQVATAVVGGLGLWASHSLLRKFLSTGLTLLAVGALAMGPMYGSMAVSFMSDVPAFALQAITLRLGYEAIRRSRVHPGWLSAAMLVGLAGFSVREYAIAAPLAVLALALITATGRRQRVMVLTLSSALLMAAVAMYAWRGRLTPASGQTPVNLTLGPADVALVVKTGLALALLCLPALLVIAPVVFQRARHREMGIPWAVAALATAVLWVLLPTRRLGNYVTPTGSYAETLAGEPPTLFPHSVWVMIQIVTLLALMLLIGAIVQCLPPRVLSSWSSTPPAFRLSTLFVAMSVLVTVVVSLVTKNTLFDRYFVAVVPFLCGVLLYGVAGSSPRRRRMGRRSAVSLGVLAFVLFSFRIVDSSATFDGAKWRLSEQVSSTGVPARVIDGGLEWFGLHQPGPVTAPRPTPAGVNFWMGLFTDPQVCVRSTFAPTAGPTDVSDPRTLTATSLTGVIYHLRAMPADLSCPESGSAR